MVSGGHLVGDIGETRLSLIIYLAVEGREHD